MLVNRNHKPYFNDRTVTEHLSVTCGRCESQFDVTLKRGRDHPLVICPKCKMENLLRIVWR